MLGSYGIQAAMSPLWEGLGPTQRRGQVCRQVTEQPVSTEEPREAEDSLGPNALCAPPNCVQMLGQARENWGEPPV